MQRVDFGSMLSPTAGVPRLVDAPMIVSRWPRVGELQLGARPGTVGCGEGVVVVVAARPATVVVVLAGAVTVVVGVVVVAWGAAPDIGRPDLLG